MSQRYFNYRSREEFEQDIRSVPAAIPLSDDYATLFKPVSIGGTSASNSCAIHPMEGCDATADGRPSPLTCRRYERFARGGAAIIWGEATAVRQEGRANTRQLWINEDNWEDFARLVDASRRTHAAEMGSAHSLVFGLQLTHSGRYSVARPFIPQRDPVLDRATFCDPLTREHPIGSDYPAVDDAYLESLQDDYFNAARLAYRAGFDFVDIKQCHRYLLSELLASRSRPGPYGASYENRTRLIKSVVARIRDGLPGLVIATRLNAFDGVPFGSDPETGRGAPLAASPFLHGWGTDVNDPAKPDLAEPLRLVAELKEAGLTLLSVSAGSPYSSPHYLRPADTPPLDGYGAPEHPAIGSQRHFDITAAFQHAFPDLAVLGAGYSWLRWLMCDSAASNLARGRCSIAGFGRAAIAYPDFLRDLEAHGRLDKNKVCVTVSYCTALMRFKHNAIHQFETGCAVRDRYYAELYQQARRSYPGRRNPQPERKDK